MPLDINTIRAYKGGDPEKVRESQRRRFADVALVDKVIAEDEEWRRLVAAADDKRGEKNAKQKEITARALAASFILFALFALASRATSTSRRWRHVPRHRRDAPRSAPEVWDPVYNWTDRETGVTTLYNRSSEVLASA